MSMKARRRRPISGSGIYRCSGVTKWVLGTEPESSWIATSILNFWTISSPGFPSYFILFSGRVPFITFYRGGASLREAAQVRRVPSNPGFSVEPSPTSSCLDWIMTGHLHLQQTVHPHLPSAGPRNRGSICYHSPVHLPIVSHQQPLRTSCQWPVFSFLCAIFPSLLALILSGYKIKLASSLCTLHPHFGQSSLFPSFVSTNVLSHLCVIPSNSLASP